ncbi:Glycosyltransferase involved in cell wall bisynthesis [Halovenus aranensis]|jgi:glycosyltransferase involved in cell wall biosynthesis|uniref:Glycosyltransferase involved in cell wall bisynthesis n=1 Tax=Halovenus aranensis TaxID=890420 RepID=A0A1G8XTM0_9EURY|nr:glycosyltransferase [Halovenus aranensis]SDJ93863.1 Glycosyltransferase involved in cell wall bisynthesis [Halovenus aranensis]
MKIGFFTDSYFPEIDGVTYTIKLWREELERRGHEVYVVYPDGDYDPRDRELPVSSLPNPFYQGYRIPLFRRPSTLPALDVVHCHGPGPVGLLGRYYARRDDLPTVYTHHTPVEEYFDQGVKFESVADALARLYLPMEETYLGSFDAVTASTERIDRNVDHVQLPVGIDLEFFEPTQERWYENRTVIGYSGRLSKEKNVDEILRVARHLPEYDFVIVGEGPHADVLKRDPPANVQFSEFLPREELPIFYSSIDTFVTASTADTLGLSTLEANACGTPVAATDAAPFDETIQPENGERFAYGDIEAMVTAIEHCLDGNRDTRGAVAQYDIDNAIDELLSLYSDAGVASESPLADELTQAPTN